MRLFIIALAANDWSIEIFLNNNGWDVCHGRLGHHYTCAHNEIYNFDWS
jgi:hypothetical protein